MGQEKKIVPTPSYVGHSSSRNKSETLHVKNADANGSSSQCRTHRQDAEENPEKLCLVNVTPTALQTFADGDVKTSFKMFANPFIRSHYPQISYSAISVKNYASEKQFILLEENGNKRKKTKKHKKKNKEIFLEVCFKTKKNSKYKVMEYLISKKSKRSVKKKFLRENLRSPMLHLHHHEHYYYVKKKTSETWNADQKNKPKKYDSFGEVSKTSDPDNSFNSKTTDVNPVLDSLTNNKKGDVKEAPKQDKSDYSKPKEGTLISDKTEKKSISSININDSHNATAVTNIISSRFIQNCSSSIKPINRFSDYKTSKNEDMQNKLNEFMSNLSTITKKMAGTKYDNKKSSLSNRPRKNSRLHTTKTQNKDNTKLDLPDKVSETFVYDKIETSDPNTKELDPSTKARSTLVSYTTYPLERDESSHIPTSNNDLSDDTLSGTEPKNKSHNSFSSFHDFPSHITATAQLLNKQNPSSCRLTSDTFTCFLSDAAELTNEDKNRSLHLLTLNNDNSFDTVTTLYLGKSKSHSSLTLNCNFSSEVSFLNNNSISDTTEFLKAKKYELNTFPNRNLFSSRKTELIGTVKTVSYVSLKSNLDFSSDAKEHLIENIFRSYIPPMPKSSIAPDKSEKLKKNTSTSRDFHRTNSGRFSDKAEFFTADKTKTFTALTPTCHKTETTEKNKLKSNNLPIPDNGLSSGTKEFIAVKKCEIYTVLERKHDINSDKTELLKIEKSKSEDLLTSKSDLPSGVTDVIKKVTSDFNHLLTSETRNTIETVNKDEDKYTKSSMDRSLEIVVKEDKCKLHNLPAANNNRPSETQQEVPNTSKYGSLFVPASEKNNPTDMTDTVRRKSDSLLTSPKYLLPHMTGAPTENKGGSNDSLILSSNFFSNGIEVTDENLNASQNFLTPSSGFISDANDSKLMEGDRTSYHFFLSDKNIPLHTTESLKKDKHKSYHLFATPNHSNLSNEPELLKQDKSTSYHLLTSFPKIFSSYTFKALKLEKSKSRDFFRASGKDGHSNMLELLKEDKRTYHTLPQDNDYPNDGATALNGEKCKSSHFSKLLEDNDLPSDTTEILNKDKCTPKNFFLTTDQNSNMPQLPAEGKRTFLTPLANNNLLPDMTKDSKQTKISSYHFFLTTDNSRPSDLAEAVKKIKCSLFQIQTSNTSKIKKNLSDYSVVPNYNFSPSAKTILKQLSHNTDSFFKINSIQVNDFGCKRQSFLKVSDTTASKPSNLDLSYVYIHIFKTRKNSNRPLITQTKVFGPKDMTLFEGGKLSKVSDQMKLRKILKQMNNYSLRKKMFKTSNGLKVSYLKLSKTSEGKSENLINTEKANNGLAGRNFKFLYICSKCEEMNCKTCKATKKAV